MSDISNPSEEYISKEHHDDLDMHRMGFTLPYGNDPESCISGFFKVGNSHQVAAADHTHQIKAHFTVNAAPIDAELLTSNPGTFYINDATKELFFKFSDGWYKYAPAGGPF